MAGTQVRCRRKSAAGSAGVESKDYELLARDILKCGRCVALVKADRFATFRVNETFCHSVSE